MNLLLTGGAGFIGSHILETALQDERIRKVRVLDNLSTGFLRNIEPFLLHPKMEFMHGDIRDRETCALAADGMEAICHQAAMGSVPRSIKTPQLTHDNNATGFINMMTAARNQNIQRIVYASSSSVYGDNKDHIKTEERIGKPLSPYAVSKHVDELYAEVYAKCYGMTIAGFRYFNVFGPRQDPYGPYAAVVPLFFKHALNGTSPTINGDGSITRDYTYVGNVVKANLNALFADEGFHGHQVLNIACGQTTSLTDLWQEIRDITGCTQDAHYGPSRMGDILHSLADISKAEKLINYTRLTLLREGLMKTVEWYSKKK